MESVGGCQIVEDFQCQAKECVSYYTGNEESMQVFDQGSESARALLQEEYFGRCVEDELERGEKGRRKEDELGAYCHSSGDR